MHAHEVGQGDASGEDFSPRRGKVNGLLADSYIIKTPKTDAHNNVTKPKILQASRWPRQL